jgi:hypothetical protein
MRYLTAKSAIKQKAERNTHVPHTSDVALWRGHTGYDIRLYKRDLSRSNHLNVVRTCRIHQIVYALGCLGKTTALASEISQKDCFQFGAVDCLIGWCLFIYSRIMGSVPAPQGSEEGSEGLSFDPSDPP